MSHEVVRGRHPRPLQKGPYGPQKVSPSPTGPGLPEPSDGHLRRSVFQRGRRTEICRRPALRPEASSHFHRASRFDPLGAFLPECHTLPPEHPPFEVCYVR